MVNNIEGNSVPTRVASGLTVKQFLFAIRKPIYVAATINLFCSFAPISLQVTLGMVWWVLSVANFVATTVCLIWVGQIAYKNIKPSIVHASLAGPVLSLFSVFLVGLVSKFRYMSGDWEPPARVAGTLLGNKLVISLVASVSGYLLLFPITMGLAALGAVLERRKHQRQEPSNNKINRSE